MQDERLQPDLEQLEEDEELLEASEEEGEGEEEAPEASEEGHEEEAPEEEAAEPPLEDEEKILLKKKLSKLQREKNRYLAEARKEREERERYQSYVEQASQVAMSHYDNTLELKLERAKEKFKEAQLLGDPEAIADALDQLTDAKTDMKLAQSWKAQESLKRQSSQQYTQEYNTQAYNNQHYPEETYEENENPIRSNPEFQRWVSRNPWFDENSREFDPNKAATAITYAGSLDLILQQKGRQDLFLTPEYFARIDRYIKENYEDEDYSRPMTMKQSRSPVAPVTRGNAAIKPRRQEVTLSADEKDFAINNLEITPEEYLKYKRNLMKEGKLKEIIGYAQ